VLEEEDSQTFEGRREMARGAIFAGGPIRGGITREPGGWASVPSARSMRMNVALPPESVSQEFEFESWRGSQCPRRARHETEVFSLGNAFINQS
jgi:hypothetical protein